MRLLKVHGSENDFFILDQNQFTEKLTDQTLDQLRQAICSRTGGLAGGADGILVVEAADSPQALAKMRVINSDGSEASMCGNGLRTVARYLAEKTQQDNFVVETMYADLQVRKAADLGRDVATYQVEISPVSFDPAAVPVNLPQGPVIEQVIPQLSAELRFSVVAVPNPHLIAFVDHQTLTGSAFDRISQQVNGTNDLFPDGVNVSFVELLGEQELFVRTFERGVGLTNACGTAMSASSLIYVLAHGGRFDTTVTVKNPGGMVQTLVHQRGDQTYWMELIGNATVTHEISGQLTDFLKKEFTELKMTETTEQQAYQDFLEKIKK